MFNLDMKIQFCANLPDFNRYSLGNHGVVKVPNMSDEQVNTANKTRNLPEDYYLITKETNYYTKNGDKLNFMFSFLFNKLTTEKPKAPIPAPLKVCKIVSQ